MDRLLPVVLLIGRDVSMWTSSRSAPWPTRRPSRADDRASTSHWKLSALTARRQCARPAGKGVATLLVKAQEPAKFRPRTLDPTLALLSPPSTCVATTSPTCLPPAYARPGHIPHSHAFRAKAHICLYRLDHCLPPVYGRRDQRDLPPHPKETYLVTKRDIFSSDPRSALWGLHNALPISRV